MNSIHPAILISLGFCLALLMYVVFEEHMGGLVKKGIMGCATMVVVNYVVPPYIIIAVNIWSIIVACLFGIPGVLVMYFIRMVKFLSF